MNLSLKAKQKICNRCNKLSYIWKNDKGSRYCKTCWLIISKSSKLPKKSSSKTYKPIAPRSSKRAKQEREYSLLRAKFLVAHPLCQAKLPGICTVNSTDVHHMRGRIGMLLTDDSNFLSVCRACHNWIELHPVEAKELGFSKKR
jgi:hypothetical protein